MAKTKWVVSIAVDDDVDYSEKWFTNTVKRILKDKKGWESVLPIEFVFVEPFEKVNHPRRIFVNLSKNDFITKKCRIDGMSCCDMSTGDVWINIERWMNGSVHSKLNIYKYRHYVINHEVGHALGFLHQTCECDAIDCDEPVPVMMQQTLSIGKCKPNPYPLKQHIKKATRKNYRN